ncbi:hypothetical protein [Flavobacterium lacus]|uniref:Polysaccharide (De)acetylase n=1 Tax=Flavobacterium lacus TaxID=1353778 RepID=A0A328WQ54_9FLAO|nr:hypothetical protein [Flavobacterium lacus]RAR47236.1 hypothetical protein B0I10_11029 [Flavobacterium lacus]
MIFNKFKSNFARNLVNIPGIKTSKKIVVLESDDWGSIRMPSKVVFDKLAKEHLYPEIDPYLRYDTLASVNDFNAMFDILRSVKDHKGNHPIVTANAVMGNPDFDKIAEHKFESYFWESFTTTWKKHSHCEGVEAAWHYGITEKFLRFQCHGREHINVDQWMLALQQGDKLVRKAFDHQMISISSQPNRLRFHFMEGLDYFSEAEKENKKVILKEALLFFKQYFGYESKSYIANCYIWDSAVESALAELGVVYLQGMTNQIQPVLKDGIHSHQYKRHFFGEQNKFGQHYLIRNAFFEPSLNTDINWISECLQRINIAFRWNKPAIIGCHRLNFIGSIHEENRTKNLEQFGMLLKEIVKRWPDVEFKSSDEVINYIKNE